MGVSWPYERHGPGTRVCARPCENPCRYRSYYKLRDRQGSSPHYRTSFWYFEIVYFEVWHV
ncbi:hypothetical protein F383_08748 [Gossypium arboreum]|uniref:Uncharacterized protein n=1 Tax=Gossypium arboreum TaxID=29729 RepID=A0A0B0P4M1_GOSAR|nr:hypothetical protein F383_08748 [Gossypium arboreum]